MTSVVLRGSARQAWVAVRALLVLTAITVVYTIAITVVGRLLPVQADGSTVTVGGRTVGSALLGQSFATASGVPLPNWFQSRPSAAGKGYDATASSPSNLGPNNPALVQTIEQRRAVLAHALGVAPARVPADAVTASASGLDPDISPVYARLQVPSVARTRHLPEAVVARLVEAAVRPPDLGYLGSPTVNVLDLNVALAKMDPTGNG